MRRSLCEQMNSQYRLGRLAGWNSHATERREKCKWDFVQKTRAAWRDLFREADVGLCR